MLRPFLFSMLAFFSLGSFGNSVAQEAPDKMIQRVTGEVMAAVRSDEAIQRGDRRSIQQLVEEKIVPHLDFERTTMLATGHYWRDATPQQRQQLQTEFHALLMHTYAGALSQVRDQKIQYDPLRADPQDTDVVVSAHATSSRGQPIDFGYRLIKSPDGWKVYDVNVLGIWMVQAYKENFSAEIRKSGIDGLIATLAEKNRSLATKNGKPGDDGFSPKLPLPPDGQQGK